MCQGVIGSLIKFKVKGRARRILLFGVGSHSGMFARNKALLVRKGWVQSQGEEVISIESDFSAWNKFTVESGSPTRSDLAILRRRYKLAAGNAKALIVHVGKHGIDDALVELLSAVARKQYNDAKAPLLKQYNDAKAQLWISLFKKKSNRVERLR